MDEKGGLLEAEATDNLSITTDSTMVQPDSISTDLDVDSIDLKVSPILSIIIIIIPFKYVIIYL